MTGDSINVAVLEQLSPPSVGINYVFDKDLKLRTVYAPDFFIAQHRVLELQGVLNHSYSDHELEELTRKLNNQKSFVTVHGGEGTALSDKLARK